MGLIPFCRCFVNLKFVSYTARRLISSFGGETIFALSSGHGKCGVSVLRISGTQTLEAVKKIAVYDKTPVPRQAIFRKFVNPESGEAIDKGLLLWFPGPKSFTGEDYAEFHVHGGTAVVTAMLKALSYIKGCRHAEAGEFSKRAFINGKLDLTEVEGLGDLIHAETEAQRKQALRQMEGDLSKLYSDWKKQLIKCTADVEAYIDFGEDENIEDGVLNDVINGVRQVLSEIEMHLNDNRQGERLRTGVHVTIVGEPNVGKSSLLNNICQRPAAIVSPIAGTTRDIVETALNIGGYPVLLSDTAGLHETSDTIEQEGVRRALARSEQADIIILVLESPVFCKTWNKDINFTNFVENYLLDIGISNKMAESYDNENNSKGDNFDQIGNNIKYNNLGNQWISNLDNIIVVINKIDLINNLDVQLIMDEIKMSNIHVCTLSCITGDGFTEFLNVLKAKVEKMCGNPLSGNPSLTQSRHRSHLTKCIEHLNRFLTYIEEDDIVLATERLRKTLLEIGKITGKISSEDILDVIFSDFCIGK